MTLVENLVVQTTDISDVSESHDALRPLLRRRLRRVGIAVFIVQFAGMVGWSAFEVHRFAEMADFAGFYQAWYLIGHGVLNPGPGWWQTQAIFIMWPLALVAAIFPHPISLLIIQDAAVVGAEMIAYFWLIDIVSKRAQLPLKEYALFGLTILVLNPWIYWSISWDYHSEAVGVFFAILTSRAFYSRRSKAWLWASVTLTCGMVPATYLLGIAAGLLLSKGRRRAGLLLVVMAGVWLLLMFKLGAGGGLLGDKLSTQESANPLKSAIHQLIQVLGRVPADAPDMLANLGPTGFIGALMSPVIGIVAVVLGSSATATGFRSVAPSFQDLAIYIYTPVGTIIALCVMSRRFGSRVGRGLMVVIVASMVAWAAVWMPGLKSHWVRVSSADAGALRSAGRLIPNSADLIASQGISGVFAGRSHIYSLMNQTPLRVPVSGRNVWFLVTAYAGTESELVSTSAGIIDFVAKDLHAKLVFQRDDVWLFEWRRPRTVSTLGLPKAPSRLPAAVFKTQESRNLGGGPQHWSMSNSGTAGLILYGDYWLEKVGRYRASVTVRSNGPFEVTLRNATTNSVLQQKTEQGTNAFEMVSLSGVITRNDPALDASPYAGIGPFSVRPVSPLRGNNLEVTVASLRTSRVDVTSVAVAKR